MEIEKELDDRDLIVSSTDARGTICYVNRTFSQISEYDKKELYGQPHNIIRHPDMPKAIFKYVWTRLLSKKPVVAYVKNYVKGNQKYYWVKAVMYPKIVNNEIDVITSYRTKATNLEIQQISEIYRMLIEYEKIHTIDESLAYFKEFLKKRKLTYGKMVNRLIEGQQILNVTLMNLDIPKFKTDHLIFRSRIESLVEKGYEDIEVVSPTMCAFGKRLAQLEGEDFAGDSKFLEIKRIHAEVHEKLEQYVESQTQKERDFHMNKVYEDIDKLFKLMAKLKDDHIHDFKRLDS